MFQLIYSPQWFYGKDIIIDLVSMLVLLLIASFSIKCYRFRKNRNYLFLGMSFGLLSVAFLFKALMNLEVYYTVVQTVHIGAITLTYETLKSADTLFETGFLIYRLLTLSGLYILYSIYHKQPRTNYILVPYLLIIATYFTLQAYYMFHITAFIMLMLITADYYKNYCKTRNQATKLLAISFITITASQVFFILAASKLEFYAIGELIQLVGYITLLATFITVLRHGRKKNKD